MKTIKKNELFENLGGFLKSKGIELNDGSYTRRIQKSCDLLTDAINATQKTVKETKVHVDQALDQLRQSIHEKTAPNPSTASAPSAGAARSPKAKNKSTGKTTALKTGTTKPKRKRKQAGPA